MSNSFSLEQLAHEIGGTFKGDASLMLKGVAPIERASADELTFLTNSRYISAAVHTKASVILTDKALPNVEKSFLLSPNPYAALAKVIGLFFPQKIYPVGIQPGAFVDPKAKVHPTASIAPGAVVSAGANVGPETVLYPGVFIGENTIIGASCIIYSNVTIRENCILGNHVILQPGVVVGADGFGFAKDGQEYRKIPQVGNVIIEDDVELGANTCVDRAVLGSTIIGKGTKLDNLIQVGHNVVIGANTVIASQTGISGSTQVGSNVIMGGQVGLAGHLKIGDYVTLATRTGVMEDILEKGVYWGSPSAKMAEEMKNVASYRQLPELIKRIRTIEKALEKMVNVKKDEKQ
jgi:UDP-3-O-[3-hydroxymyristoyl] glucosamine N-acyltransferase